MKYNEIMDRIRVDEAMRSRVLQKVSEAAESEEEPGKVTDLRGRLTVKRVLPVAAAAALVLIIGSAAVSGVFSRNNATAASAPQESAALAEEYAMDSAESDEMAAEAYESEATEEAASGNAVGNALASAETEAAAEDKPEAETWDKSLEEGEEEAADEAVETPAEEAEEISGGTAETAAEGAEAGAEADGAGPASSEPTDTPVQVGTITELSELAGFEVRELTNLPFELTAVTYLYQAGQGARIVYESGSEEAVFTMTDEEAPATEFSSYEDVMVIHSGGREIALCGADRKYTLAVWEADGHACSLELSSARSQSVWRRIGFV